MLLTTAFSSMTAGALLLTLVTRTAVPSATWLAFVFLLHATRSLPAVIGLTSLLVVVYVSLAVGNWNVIPVPGPAYFAVVAGNASFMLLPFVLDRVLQSRLDGIGMTLVFPVTFVAFEFLKSRITPAATWGSIAYTQYGYLPIMQVASVVGIWGITFIITWFSSTIEWSWRHDFEVGMVRTPLVVCLGVLSAIVLVGGMRVSLATTASTAIRMATLNRPVDLFVPGEMTRITEGRVRTDEMPQLTTKLARLHDWFLESSRREARAGARLVVWPEANLLVFRQEEPAFLERARRLAADEHVYLAMGIASIQPGAMLPFENKMILVDPSGQIVVDYLKSHPVAGWEASIMQRGDGWLPVVATGAGRIAGVICFDADFPEFVRQAGRNGAELLIVPANDSRGFKEQHLQMAAFRAIENGTPLIRAAASGISGAFDPWGRVLAISDYFAPGDRTMTAQVPIGRTWTLYPIIGDLFAWCCVVLLVLSLAALIVRPSIARSISAQERAVHVEGAR